MPDVTCPDGPFIRGARSSSLSSFIVTIPTLSEICGAISSVSDALIVNLNVSADSEEES